MHPIVNILREEKSYHPDNFKSELIDYHPDSLDYRKFWQDEIKKCIEGIWINGRYCPPQLYTYANYGIIERLSDDNVTSQKTTQPKLRDIEWLFFYNWFICRKFSGFELDEKYTCNRNILDPKFKKDKASKYVLQSNGNYKEYVDAREYLYMKHDKHYGLPIYENNALNLILLTSRGCGKAQPLNSKIRIKGGWTTMKDIQIGDELYGRDGNLYQVTNKTELQENLEMYNVNFDNGFSIKCCKDHLWLVYDNKGKEYIYNTKTLIDKLKTEDYYIPVNEKLSEVNINKPYTNAIGISDLNKIDYYGSLGYYISNKNKYIFYDSSIKRIMIKNIKQSTNEDGYCIEVNSPDNTYITDNYIVTHNSYWGMACALHEFIFNSCITFDQLIKELKSNEKTKVNCILTCELEDKAVDLMNKIKTWYELMPGSYGQDDEYVPSPLYRAYTGSWNNKITQQIEKYYFTKDGTKAKRFDGSGSTLGIITFNKDPYKTAGKRNSVTIVEEIGLCPNLHTFWNANRDVQRVGRVKFGSTLGIGTGGSIDRVQSSKRIFENPSLFDCLAFDDTFENTGKQIGLFVPAYLGNNDFKDERGITEIEDAIAYYDDARKSIIANHGTTKDLDEEIMNRPIFPSEMFLNKRGNIFPVYELKECLYNLVSDEKRLNGGNKGMLVRTSDVKSGVIFEPDLYAKYSYIDTFPIPKEFRKDKDYIKGCIRIWEHPDEGVPKGTYKIGYDTVHYDFVENPESLISVLVYKGNVRFLSSNNIYYDSIVAEYTGRYDLLDKNNEIVELLSKYYNNAEIMMEVNIGVNIEYFKRRGLLHLLANQPKELLDKHIKNRQSNNMVGYIKSPELVGFLEQSTKEWLEKERGVTDDGKIIRNMHMINSKPLLEELISYNREDNFDRVNALFALMLAYKEENLDIEDIDFNENKFMKSIMNNLPSKKKKPSDLITLY